MTFRRGQIALAFYPFASGTGGSRRPVLIIQSDLYNRRIRNSIVARITTNLRRASDPAHLLIELATPEGQQSGLLHDSVVSCLNLATLTEDRLEKVIGSLPDAAMTRVPESRTWDFPSGKSHLAASHSSQSEPSRQSMRAAVVRLRPTAEQIRYIDDRQNNCFLAVGEDSVLGHSKRQKAEGRRQNCHSHVVASPFCLLPSAFCLGILLFAAGCRMPLRAVTESHVTTTSPPIVDTGPLTEFTVVPGDPNVGERIALVDVDGVLLNTDMTGFYSLGENPVAIFREKLDHIAANRCFRGVVLRINSPGGGVTACDMMRHDLATFKARTGMPVVACLLDVGAGGAYYLATAADQIVAHPTTVTGGIGVVLNLYNLQDAMAQFNVVGVPIKSGEHIDMGTPIRQQDDDVRAMLQTMAGDFHQRFRGAVEQARPWHDPRHGEDFDGRVFTAGQALDRRLIDSIGYLDDAVAIARQAARVPAARVVLLHRRVDRARSPYSVTPNVPMQGTMLPVSIPGLERSRLPTFLYLWQPDPTLERWGGK